MSDFALSIIGLILGVVGAAWSFANIMRSDKNETDDGDEELVTRDEFIALERRVGTLEAQRAEVDQ